MQEFIRIKSTDNIEMCGIIYKPRIDTKKAIIHIHGLAGNFYENRFISYLAKHYTDNGYIFLTFNNRGNGYFSDLLKDDKSINGGGAYESFVDSIYDIKGAINYLENLGINEIILQGHSYGCNKVIYYYSNEDISKIKRLILLAPCDTVAELKHFVKDKYSDCFGEAKENINNNEDYKLITSPLFPTTFSSKTFLNDWVEDATSDIFRYRLDNYKHQYLTNIKIPVLVEIGTKDHFVLVVDKDKVANYLKCNIQNVKIDYIDKAKHNYIGFENDLVKNIENWLNNK